MIITLIHKLNENGVDAVYAPVENFDDAQKVVAALNQKAEIKAKAVHSNWEDYADFYYAKEYVVLSPEEIIAAIG